MYGNTRPRVSPTGRHLFHFRILRSIIVLNSQLASLSKTKDWTDFIAKQVVIQAIRLGKLTSALHFSAVIGTHQRAFYQFYTWKEKIGTLLPWRKAFPLQDSINHHQNSHFLKLRKSTQSVSTYSKRLKRGEEQFYKPATHLNVPPMGLVFFTNPRGWDPAVYPQQWDSA